MKAIGRQAGSLKERSGPSIWKEKDGYTLLELIIVIALLGIILAFTMPRLESNFLSDNTKKFSRWLIWMVRNTKVTASQSGKTLALHLDIGTGKVWTVDTSLDETAQHDAEERAYEIPEGVVILDVEFPHRDQVTMGTAVIMFYPNGYSDKALVHYENEDSERKTIQIEPFLSKVRLIDEYKRLDDFL